MFRHIPLKCAMYTSSQSNCRIFQVQKTNPNCCTSFVHNKALQALKETPDDCENTFFNKTNFNRFHVHLFKIYFPQMKDQTDADSLINAMVIRLLNQNHSLDTCHEQKNSDA